MNEREKEYLQQWIIKAQDEICQEKNNKGCQINDSLYCFITSSTLSIASTSSTLFKLILFFLDILLKLLLSIS